MYKFVRRKKLSIENIVLEALKSKQFSVNSPSIKIYKDSYSKHGKDKIIMYKSELKKYLMVIGGGDLYNKLIGEEFKDAKICELTHKNRLVLNEYFHFTKPQSFGNKVSTLGLGDRLGLATPGHIQACVNANVKPIFAQQSIRELDFMKRKLSDVIDAASFAVFQEGYKGGFGADGDHLKNEEDIKLALDVGVTMLTLDCSDYIKNEIESIEENELIQLYEKLPDVTINDYEERYLNKQLTFNEQVIEFSNYELIKMVLIYKEALDYTCYIYDKYMKSSNFDFELSIDETETVTTPQQHYFVANELKKRGVQLTSLAPRFCGEFQKGIDYIGDINEFTNDIKIHSEIAKYFGYKLSIHSGSDKFSIFPIIGQATSRLLHLKTAGTSWLEAVRLISMVNPKLFKSMYQSALKWFSEAQKSYHVTVDIERIKNSYLISNEKLPSLMDNNDIRQLFHITYGFLLNEKDKTGNYLYKDNFFETIIENEDTYSNLLKNHIGKHIQLLDLY